MIEKNLLKFKARVQEFAKNLRSLEQCIQTVKGQNNVWEQNAFLPCSFWRFLISNKLVQLELIVEKKYWDLETCRKLKLSFRI